ncbi:MAG: hypothetical protein GC149_18575 [Gammaproteobacteria bacterium]|nr:hypothetical protein [Gammaproteobacteria bacterium]
MKKAGFVLLFFLFAPPCFADFALYMYMGDSLRSGAGKNSTANNAAVTFTNPGALVDLPTHSTMIEGQYFDSRMGFHDTGSTDVIGNPLTGGDGGNGGESQFVPGFYLANKLNDRWSYGLALNVPFGLSVNWPDDWKGRYQVTKTGIETININPAVAYRINPQVSVGFGISAQYANAELANAIDFGAVCFSQLDPTTCSGLGMTPQAADGKVTVKGNDWGYGYNFGFYITASAKTRVGVSYRSKIDYKLEGTADFTIPTQATVFNPAFTDTHVSVPLTLPEMVSAGLTHAFTPQFLLSADATWTRWSRLQSFEFTFENPAQPALSIERNWKDAWRYALGAEYVKNSKWTYQGGIAFTQSAIPNETLDPAIPISDAWSFSGGFIYAVSTTMHIGAGFTHLEFANRSTNHTSPYGDTLRGELRPKLDIYSLQAKWVY